MVLLPDLTAPTTARRQVSSLTWACTCPRTREPVLSLGRRLGKEAGPVPGQLLEWFDFPDQSLGVAVSGTLDFLSGSEKVHHFLGAKPAM